MNRQQRRQAARETSKVPAPPLVVIVCHNGQTRGSFTFSLCRLMVAETCRQGFPPGLIWQRFGSDQLVDARNDSVRFFLDHYSESEWVLFLDADMGFAAETAQLLQASADVDERPIVGGLCFALKRDGVEDEITQAVDLKMQPTLYLFHDLEDDAGFASIDDYQRDGLVQVAGTGMACVLVHRRVLAAMVEKYGTWFDRIPNPKKPTTTFGEDLSFFVRAAGCDFPVFVDTGVRTSHDKDGVFLTEARWDDQQRARSARLADAS